jgi:AcrR family transcriptional regulator
MRFRARNAEATKAALMRAGANAFALQGFDGATLEQIAEAADVNKAMVAYYFGDKAGLFQAILEEAVEYILARVAREVDSLAQPDAQLAAYISALGEMMAARPFFPSMVLKDFQSGRFQRDPALLQRLLKFSQITHRIMADGEARGVFQTVDHHMMHLTIVGSLAYFVASQRFRDDVSNLQTPTAGPQAMPGLEEFIGHLTQTVLRSLRA